MSLHGVNLRTKAQSIIANGGGDGGGDGVKPRTLFVCRRLWFDENFVLNSVRNIEKRSQGLPVLCETFPEAFPDEMLVCRRETRTRQVPISFASLAPLVQDSLFFKQLGSFGANGRMRCANEDKKNYSISTE